MSALDPRKELSQVIELRDLGLIPAGGGEWAASAYKTTEAILDTIDAMQSDGIQAPTPRQKEALFNIHQAAWNWLDPGNVIHTPEAKPVPRPRRRLGEVGGSSRVELVDGTVYQIGADCSVSSPVAQALIGHVAGDTVTAVLPKGNSVTMTILAVVEDVQELEGEG